MFHAIIFNSSSPLFDFKLIDSLLPSHLQSSSMLLLLRDGELSFGAINLEWVEWTGDRATAPPEQKGLMLAELSASARGWDRKLSSVPSVSTLCPLQLAATFFDLGEESPWADRGRFEGVSFAGVLTGVLSSGGAAEVTSP